MCLACFDPNGAELAELDLFFFWRANECEST